MKRLQQTLDQILSLLKNIAISRGGQLLSKKYLGGRVKLKFKDAAGNIFWKAPEQLKLGSWSPHEGSISEPLCRQAMNHLFSTNFEKTMSVLTPSVTGRKYPLELDGYCDKLKMAFEYQGHQSHWRTSFRTYDKVHEKDLLKKKVCKKIGIDLIVIPPFKENKDKWKSHVVLEHVIKAINKFYKSKKTNLPVLNIANFKVDLSNNNHCLKMLNRLKKIASDNDGKLLSRKWKGTQHRYKFEDKKGVIFFIVAGNLFNNKRGWPKNTAQLAKTGKDYINQMPAIAKKNGGKLLEDIWLGNEVEHRFIFTDGRAFSYKPNKLKQDGWPKHINNYFAQKLASSMSDEDKFNRLKKIAEDNGGKILHDKWMGYKFKYQFLYSDGRPFEMNSQQILANGWPKGETTLFNSDEDYLQELKDIALANEGTLLDTKWKGNRSTYRFLFKDGREFSIVPASLKNRGWPKDPDSYFNQLKGKFESPEDKIKNLHEILHANKGKCLDNKWLTASDKYNFEFEDGRKFSMHYSSLKKTGWPKDANNYFKALDSKNRPKEDRLKEIHDFAKQNNGKCLENTWTSVDKFFKFQFEDGREFNQTPYLLLKYGWPKNPDKFLKMRDK